MIPKKPKTTVTNNYFELVPRVCFVCFVFEFMLVEHCKSMGKSCWSLKWYFGTINWVDNVNWPLTVKSLKADLLLWQRANTWNVSFENTVYSGQFMLSTQLIIPNYFVILSHWHSTTVALTRNLPPLFIWSLKWSAFCQFQAPN